MPPGMAEEERRRKKVVTILTDRKRFEASANADWQRGLIPRRTKRGKSKKHKSESSYGDLRRPILHQI